MTIVQANYVEMYGLDDGVDGQKIVDDQPGVASTPVSPALIASIREACAMRRDTLKATFRITNQTLALVRRALGYQTDMSESDTKKLCKRAVAIVASIQKGLTAPVGEEDVAEAVAPFVLSSCTATIPFVSYRTQLEKTLTAKAKLLPVYPWCESVKGFGALGLAIIVGECGDLSGYSNPAKVWKRMGLAVMGSCRQGGLPKGSPAEAWIEHGYSPRRRSAMWTLGDSLLRQQNEYRELYLARKATEIQKALAEGLVVVSTTKATVENWRAAGLEPIEHVKKLDKDKHRQAGHIAQRAQRYAEKRLLRNLWRAWRDA